MASRREIILGIGAIPFSPNSAFASGAARLVSVADRTALIPSPLSTRFLDCAELRRLTARIELENPLLRVGIVTSPDTTRIREQSLRVFSDEISKTEAEIARLRGLLSSLNKKELEAGLFLFLDSFAFAISAITFVTGSTILLTYGAPALLAYGIAKFAYQVIYDQNDPTSTISFVTSTRNSSISLISTIGKLPVGRAFEVYSIANETIFFGIGLYQSVRSFRQVKIESGLAERALNELSAKVTRLKSIATERLSSDSNFVEYLYDCRDISAGAMRTLSLSQFEQGCGSLPITDFKTFWSAYRRLSNGAPNEISLSPML